MNQIFERSFLVGKTTLQRKKHKNFKDRYVKNYGKEVMRDEIITGIPLALVGAGALMAKKTIHETLAAAVIKPLASQAGKAALKSGLAGSAAGSMV